MDSLRDIQDLMALLMLLSENDPDQFKNMEELIHFVEKSIQHKIDYIKYMEKL